MQEFLKSPGVLAHYILPRPNSPWWFTALTQRLAATSFWRSFSVSKSFTLILDKMLLVKEDDLALRDLIEEILLDFPCYGYRRVTVELHRRGVKVNHKRVLRIMRQNNLI
ncbi:MAG: hypothetical protein DRN81_04570 [Thermoproteota archaeon]|nr:MAG: hypothetical protein DRN81_04570 [Candidatus Korarchaeota archaeon]